MTVALAAARKCVNEEMLERLLAQLYEREYQFQGHALRDVAAYSLMRLIQRDARAAA